MTPEDAAVIVRKFEDEYAAAFNRMDASALSALFTEEATIVTEWGDVVKGRAEFERGLTRAFARGCSGFGPGRRGPGTLRRMRQSVPATRRSKPGCPRSGAHDGSARSSAGEIHTAPEGVRSASS